MKKSIYIFTALLLIAFYGCEGPAGSEGPQGQQGPPGEDGVANVTTEIFTINSNNTEISDGIGLNAIATSVITPEVVENGFVQVEIQVGDIWFGLPWTFGNDYNDDLGVDETVELTYGYEAGTLYIAHISSYSKLTPSQVREGPYKVIIIPPTETSSDMAASKEKHRINTTLGDFIQQYKTKD